MKEVEQLTLCKIMYQIDKAKDSGVILTLTKEQCHEAVDAYMNIKHNYDTMEKAIEILKNKPYVLTIGLENFKWDEEIQEYSYVEAKWVDALDYDYDDNLIETSDLVYEDYYLTKEEYMLLEEVL